VGVGEKLDALENLEPERNRGSYPCMGDIVALARRPKKTLEVEQAERMMKRYQKGSGSTLERLRGAAGADAENGRRRGPIMG